MRIFVFSRHYLAMSTPAPARAFEDLVVWQEAHRFVIGVYRASARFPKSEIHGLSSQMRIAAVSIAANIAESFRQHSRTDKVRFLNMAQASAEECRYYTILAHDLGYLETQDLASQVDKISYLLDRYLKGIQQNHRLKLV